MGLFKKFLLNEQVNLRELLAFIEENMDYEAPLIITCRNGEYLCSSDNGTYYTIAAAVTRPTILILPDPSGKILYPSDLADVVSIQIDSFGGHIVPRISIRDEKHEESVHSHEGWDVQIGSYGYNCLEFTGIFRSESETWSRIPFV